MDSERKIRVLRVVTDTIVDGPHLRNSIYFPGCYHHCPGCHNPESWDPNGGVVMTFAEILEKLVGTGSRYLTLSGGDPFCSPDVQQILELVRYLKLEIPQLDVWAYSGYTLGYLENHGTPEQKELLQELSGLVDGPFVLSLKREGLRFRGSRNQVIYERDPKSLEWIRSEKYNN